MSGSQDAGTGQPSLSPETLEILMGDNESTADPSKLINLFGNFKMGGKMNSGSDDSSSESEAEEDRGQFDYVAYYKERFPERY
eukprot:CAMPEP_0204840138 /NCGR_PEP_ID=MMETSP1346-20131115/36567_1 /ASSEMBLY_ACC=CAM_ASM_000771 /TAXON_ID=215587 /ORGANISM="Aplanochytrium stocchinoi, Strain GSBS06" /LENGTH=82 /DNA_ID=CAMNT_0051977357 /DNA_START=94 /DNA_END=339 /DNA_ORIENTATION=-